MMMMMTTVAKGGWKTGGQTMIVSGGQAGGNTMSRMHGVMMETFVHIELRTLTSGSGRHVRGKRARFGVTEKKAYVSTNYIRVDAGTKTSAPPKHLILSRERLRNRCHQDMLKARVVVAAVFIGAALRRKLYLKDFIGTLAFVVRACAFAITQKLCTVCSSPLTQHNCPGMHE